MIFMCGIQLIKKMIRKLWLPIINFSSLFRKNILKEGNIINFSEWIERLFECSLQIGKESWLSGIDFSKNYIHMVLKNLSLTKLLLKESSNGRYLKKNKFKCSPFNNYLIFRKIVSNKIFNDENCKYLLYFNISNLIIFIFQNPY